MNWGRTWVSITYIRPNIPAKRTIGYTEAAMTFFLIVWLSFT
jgi:hypothetical protein